MPTVQETQDERALLSRITSRPEVFGGKPIIRDRRISVDMVLGLMVQGEPMESLLADFPDLEPDDIRACLAFARKTLPRNSKRTGYVL